MVAAERREELLASVGELSEDERLVISYRYFLGLSEEETATTLGCARGTVKSRALARHSQAAQSDGKGGRCLTTGGSPRREIEQSLRDLGARVEYPLHPTWHIRPPKLGRGTIPDRLAEAGAGRPSSPRG